MLFFKVCFQIFDLISHVSFDLGARRGVVKWSGALHNALRKLHRAAQSFTIPPNAIAFNYRLIPDANTISVCDTSKAPLTTT